jgi:hypothetical protein
MSFTVTRDGKLYSDSICGVPSTVKHRKDRLLSSSQVQKTSISAAQTLERSSAASKSHQSWQNTIRGNARLLRETKDFQERESLFHAQTAHHIWTSVVYGDSSFEYRSDEDFNSGHLFAYSLHNFELQLSNRYSLDDNKYPFDENHAGDILTVRHLNPEAQIEVLSCQKEKIESQNISLVENLHRAELQADRKHKLGNSQITDVFPLTEGSSKRTSYLITITDDHLVSKWLLPIVENAMPIQHTKMFSEYRFVRGSDPLIMGEVVKVSNFIVMFWSLVWSLECNSNITIIDLTDLRIITSSPFETVFRKVAVVADRFYLLTHTKIIAYQVSKQNSLTRVWSFSKPHRDCDFGDTFEHLDRVCNADLFLVPIYEGRNSGSLHVLDIRSGQPLLKASIPNATKDEEFFLHGHVVSWAARSLVHSITIPDGNLTTLLMTPLPDVTVKIIYIANDRLIYSLSSKKDDVMKIIELKGND